MDRIEDLRAVGAPKDRDHVFRRILVLVAEAKRQKRLDDLVWRRIWWSIPAGIAAALLIAAGIVVARTLPEAFEAISARVRYALAEKVTTQAVLVQRFGNYGGFGPQMHVDYVTAQEQLLASKLLMSSPYVFVRDRALPPSDWTVRVTIRIAKDGSLAGLILEKPSNSAELNRAACHAIQNAFPLSAPPAELIDSVHRARGYVPMTRWLRFHHRDAAIVGAYIPYEVLDGSARINCRNLLNPP